jgi:hypothetical protein
MPNERTWKALWWLCLVVAPAVLVAIELFHPAQFTITPGTYQYLSKPEAYDPHHYALAYPGPDWWFVLHMIQTPMVGLVAVGLWIMVGRVTDADGAAAIALAWLSRVATFVFIIYYTALDAIGGFGLARAIIDAQTLMKDGTINPDHLKDIEALLNATWRDPWTGGVSSLHQPDGIVGGVRRRSARGRGAVPDAKSPVATARRVRGLRLGAAGEPREPARADRVRPADRGIAVDMVERS